MLTMPAAAPALELTDDERETLERLVRSTSARHRTVQQAKALLLAAEGVANNEIGRRVGVSANSVRAWRSRFDEKRVADFGAIAPGRGRKSWIPEGTVAAVVHDTLHALPDDGSTHWTTRSMAARHGIGKDTVARIWRDHNLKPWQTKRFEVSNDSRFEEKLVDVVGLCLNPPERAAAFSFDEKTQCQALDRTSGQEFGGASTFVYNMSKAAGRQLATSLATRYAADGIRVNAMAPGVTRTKQLRHFLPDLTPEQEDAIFEGARQVVPLGRVADPSEIARAILFLVSDQTSSVSDATLFADGAFMAR
jgi:NAD(P)-dependent dehydrogenase (short-subunit alcohol dehydrogenase family)